jgi:phosphatidylglycerol:prolipoprotein diacylglycerol transferase
MLHDSINSKKFTLAIIVASFWGCFYFLRLVFSGFLILPQSFPLGPLTIHYYGIIMAIAVAAGFYFAVRRAKNYNIGESQAEDILFWTIIGGFIGARLYHVLSSAGYYYQYPIDIFKVWNGGLSIYGAVLGGIISLVICKKAVSCQLSSVSLLDWLAPCVLLGQIIGRFGNLFNYEAFGYPTGLPWKMFVPSNFRPQIYQNFNFFHPFFLYEILGNFLILLLLQKVFKFRRPGSLFFFYVLLYNALRFCLEFLRIDSTFIYGFRLNALMSLILCAAALAGLLYVRSRHVQIS